MARPSVSRAPETQLPGSSTVISGDLDVVAQSAPRTRTRFVAVDLETALSLRAERLGVLQVSFQGPVSAGLLRGLQEVALATTYTLVVCGSFSDVVEVTRRAEPLTLAAEEA